MVGGYGLARRAFRLSPEESLVVGLASGLLLQGVLGNLLGRFLPLPLNAWVVSLGIGLSGILLARRVGLWQWPRPSGWWFLLAGLGGLGWGMARGLAIFDDYAHLPTLSLMAAGDFPPHFAYDPSIPYGYHHFLLLIGAQIMRVAQWQPWSALDAARALSFALAIALGALWAGRVSGRALGAVLGGMAIALLSGMRWALLVLPHGLLERLAAAVTLIGSGQASGDNLAHALLSPWAIDGSGPLAFPFAFGNGLLEPGVLLLNAVNGLMPYVVLLVLLLSATRWRDPLVAGVLSTAFLAADHLMGESDLPYSLAAWGLITLIWWLRNRPRPLPRSLVSWWRVVLAATLLALIQGGTWSDLAQRGLQRLLGASSPPSYQTLGFAIVPTPALVSVHLGVLPLTRPATLGVALLEAGPLLAVWPLVMVWGWKALRSQRWYEAALAAVALISLPALWVRFTGSTGVRNTTRLYAFLPVCLVFAVPALWLWLKRRSTLLRGVVLTLGAMAALSGVVFGAFEITAIGNPVASYYLTPLDVRMYRAYWNRLPQHALIFDPNPSRAPTLFARFTRAGDTWYHFKPEWLALVEAPDPYRLRAAGFDFAYLDRSYWDALKPELKARWHDACVHSVDTMENQKGDFRWLVDIRDCTVP